MVFLLQPHAEVGEVLLEAAQVVVLAPQLAGLQVDDHVIVHHADAGVGDLGGGGTGLGARSEGGLVLLGEGVSGRAQQQTVDGQVLRRLVRIGVGGIEVLQLQVSQHAALQHVLRHRVALAVVLGHRGGLPQRGADHQSLGVVVGTAVGDEGDLAILGLGGRHGNARALRVLQHHAALDHGVADGEVGVVGHVHAPAGARVADVALEHLVVVLGVLLDQGSAAVLALIGALVSVVLVTANGAVGIAQVLPVAQKRLGIAVGLALAHALGDHLQVVGGLAARERRRGRGLHVAAAEGGGVLLVARGEHAGHGHGGQFLGSAVDLHVHLLA